MPPIPQSSRFVLSAFVIYGLWGGWTLPESQEGEHFPIGPLGVLLALAPGIGFIAASIWGKPWHIRSGTMLPAFLDRALGNGTHQFLLERAGITLVLGVSAALTGCVGLARSLLLQAGSSPILLSTFFLSAGLGMLFMFLTAIRRHGARVPSASDA